MKHLYKFALGTVAVIGLSTTTAHANDFTSHHLVDEKPYERYAEQLPSDEKLELREYLDYEQREPCQNYQEIPQGFIMDGCHLKREEPKVTTKYVPMKEPEPQMQIGDVISDYEINFAFDSAAIEPAAGYTIDQIAEEIKEYKPGEVTVAGHTDTVGSAAYNADLSARRADAVSQALTEHGVENRIIDEEAYGESDLAVETRDEVRLRENRRVVVEFRK